MMQKEMVRGARLYGARFLFGITLNLVAASIFVFGNGRIYVTSAITVGIVGVVTFYRFLKRYPLTAREELNAE